MQLSDQAMMTKVGSIAPKTAEEAKGDAVRATLRILHVIPQADGSNSDYTFAKRQVSSLRGSGMDHQVFYFYPARRRLAQWRQLRAEVRRFRPHLLHAHYGTLTAFLCGVGMGVPLVVTFRGSDLNPDNSVGRLRFAISHLLSQFAAWRARSIVCVSRELRSRLWWGSKKVSISSGGIDVERYRPISREEARGRLGWPATAKVVLFNAGRNAVLKRLDLAHQAVEAGRARVPDLQMIVMNGEVEPVMVPTLLSASDCLLVTSDSEGSPYIVKEALACNLPIVSVAVGDVPERLAAVRPSRIVQRDADQLGNAIAEIVAAGKRSNGRDTIADISEEAENERLRWVYAQAVERR